MAAADAATRGDRLRVACSASVVAALLAASRLQELPASVREEAARCAQSGDPVSWRLLRHCCRALREARAATDGAADDAWLQVLARSGGLQLPSAPQGRPRSVELERRVEQLRTRAQERAYQSLVRDVTRKEREERERVPLGATLRDVGFGMHVITVMGACFLAALVAGRRLFADPGAQVAFGAVGMLVALLVETGLFMIQEGRKSGALPAPRRAPVTVLLGLGGVPGAAPLRDVTPQPQPAATR